jgi:capping protein (actin filament) muscle Z-line, beta
LFWPIYCILNCHTAGSDVGEGDRYVKNGNWNSIHVVEAVETEGAKSATYKLTTTVMLSMNIDKQEFGETLWSGTLTRQVFSIDDVECVVLLI